ncbi:MAG: uroporphyrinogen-III C-methyltransferase [Actinomycetota bacterium]
MTAMLWSWRLGGERVVVVGAGTIAEQKVELLRTVGADLVVIGPESTPRLRDLAADGVITLVERRVRRRDVRGARLVVIATDDRPLNVRVRGWAHRAGAVVNAVDDPDLCDVTVPAMIRRGPALIGVSTDGASPAAARFVREELERSLPGDVGRLVQQAAHARRELRETGRYRYDYPAWRDHFFAPGLASIRRRTGSLDEVRRRFLAGFDALADSHDGRVVIVGAGPGGADLITVRGARALESADVVVYDRLVDPELLDLAPSSAIRIPVGKSKGSGTSQEEIHRLLVHHACAGDRVVRLKGGDPFVFGRGAEECEALAEAGIDHEVVPGVTSSIAAAELAGIPVTRRGTSASFTVLSGHRADDDEYDWSALAGSASTLVVMMASSTARIVAGRLLDAGGGPDAAAAFDHAAGRPDMRSVTTSLGAIATDGCPFPAPTVMIVGDVVAAPPVPGSTRSAPIPA